MIEPGGSRAVLVTNRGLVFGEPAQHSWRMMCSTALGIPLAEQPDLAFLPDGRLLAATTQGLRATNDSGCTWAGMTPFESSASTSLAQHPADPKTLYVSVSAATQRGVHRSSDAGGSWAQCYAAAEGESLVTLAIAESMPSCIYAISHVASQANVGASHALLRSSDAGQTWEKSAITLNSGENRARLTAISPQDPNLVLVLALHESHGAEQEPLPKPGPDRLLVTRDGGQSWTTLLSSIGLFDAGFGSDGKTVWIAGTDALWRADAALRSAELQGDAQLMTCAGAQHGVLYACGHHSGFDPAQAGVGVSTDDGSSWKPWMAFTEIKQTVACDVEANTTQQCAELWTDWQIEILVQIGGAPIDSVVPSGPPAGRGAAGASAAADGGGAPAAGAGASPGGQAVAGEAHSQRETRSNAAASCGLARSSSQLSASHSWPLLLLVLWLISWRCARSYRFVRRAAWRNRTS